MAMMFEDLNKPISEMSHEEAMEFLRDLRSQRVTRKNAPYKVKQKKKKITGLAKMFQSLSPEERKKLLEEL